MNTGPISYTPALNMVCEVGGDLGSQASCVSLKAEQEAGSSPSLSKQVGKPGMCMTHMCMTHDFQTIYGAGRTNWNTGGWFISSPDRELEGICHKLQHESRKRQQLLPEDGEVLRPLSPPAKSALSALLHLRGLNHRELSKE